jgi:hypothetical protein
MNNGDRILTSDLKAATVDLLDYAAKISGSVFITVIVGCSIG